MPYRELNPDRLIETLRQVQERLQRYFPDATLSQVMMELQQVAEKAKAQAAAPRRVLNTSILALMLFVAAVAGFAFWVRNRIRGEESVTLLEMFQGLEAAINICVFLAIGLGFLFTLETRMRRRKILAAVDELRSLAHVIDLHQIRKDPEGLIAGAESTPTDEVAYSPLELVRYLDYASDMLSIVGKLAALYGKGALDGVVLESINSVETLTASISQKIWQKITIALSVHQTVAQLAAKR